jgi:serine/threonine protein kinase/tetratricopeptide (TPR) repeat protein
MTAADQESSSNPKPQELSSTFDSIFADPTSSERVRRSSAPLPELPGYEILSELGRAGMGVVYKARHVKLDVIVAVKMLRDGALAAGEQLDRFCNEAQILANLEHPNIVRILEIGEHEGRLHMALEFAEGGNLAQFLQKKRPTAAESARLIEQLARAMHHVHLRGVLHRDLKPANILLQADSRPMIADFGLGKRDDKDHTISGAILGTPSYMSPEQAHGKGHEVGVGTDVYQLGAIFYECLTGQPPFKGATVMDTLDLVRNERPRPPRQLAAGISLELEAICLKCLEKEPIQRYISTEELADELARALTGKTLQATPLSENQEQRRKRTSAAVAQGLKFLDGGSMREALVWFAEALQRDCPSDSGETVTPTTWREQVHRIRLGCLLRQLPRLVQLWFPATPSVRAAFSPQGQRLATAAEDGTVRILDLETAKIVAESSWHQANVNRLSFSADGRLLVSASDDGTARVWDPNLGEALSPPLVHQQWVTHAAFSLDGRLVVTGCVDGSARVWDWESGQERFPAVEHGGMLWAVVFSPDGQCFATAGWNGLTRLWNAQTGTPIGQTPLKHGDSVRMVVFSSDSLRLATCSDDGTARVWSVATGAPVTLPLKHPSPVRRVAFSQDDRYLLTWTDDNVVRVWEADNGLARLSDLPSLVLGGLADRSPEGRRQLECGEEGVLRLWDWGHLGPRDSHWDRWLGRGTTPVSSESRGSGHGERRRTKTAPSGPQPTAPPISVKDLPRICASANNELVVLRMPDGCMRVHDAETGEPITALLPNEGTLQTVQFSLDGRTLTIIAEQGRQRVIDLTPETMPTQQLVQLVQLLTGRRLDENGLLKPVRPDELAELWEQFRDRCPALFRVDGGEIERWHEEAARSCEASGLWAEAVGHLEVLQQLKPASAALWVRRANVWARGKNWRQASESYCRALDLEDNWRYWYGLGLVNLQLGEWNRAGRDFTRAGTQQECWQAWYYRAVAQIHLERFRHALADLTEAIKRQPRSRVCLAMRGCLYGHHGRWELALADFAQARDLGERRPAVQYMHALLCLKREDHAAHQTLAREMLELAEKSRDIEIGAWAAWVSLLGPETPADMDRLLVWVERARASHREVGSVLQQFSHTLHGLALCRLGRWADAVKHLENPPVGEGTAWDWVLLAWALHQQGQVATARQWLKRAYRWLGWIAPRSQDTPPDPRILPWHQKLELRSLRLLIEPLFQESERPTGESPSN